MATTEDNENRDRIPFPLFMRLVFALIAGIGYGMATRNTGHSTPTAALTGVGAFVATMTWLEQFEWKALLATSRGWALIATAVVFGAIFATGAYVTIPPSGRILGTIAAGFVAFGVILRAIDHVVGGWGQIRDEVGHAAGEEAESSPTTTSERSSN